MCTDQYLQTWIRSFEYIDGNRYIGVVNPAVRASSESHIGGTSLKVKEARRWPRIDIRLPLKRRCKRLCLAGFGGVVRQLENLHDVAGVLGCHDGGLVLAYPIH